MISGSSVGTSRDASRAFSNSAAIVAAKDAGGVAYSNPGAAPSSAASAGRTRISRANRIGGADRTEAPRRTSFDATTSSGVASASRVRVENASTSRRYSDRSASSILSRVAVRNVFILLKS